MTRRSLLRYGRLVRRFRNGWRLVRALRGGPPCDSVVLWDGTRISHPTNFSGLAEIIVEIWLDQPYTQGGFYRPAEGDVIVDAGANVGAFSIWVARQNPHCRVVALEPFAENFKYLEANLRAAGLGPGRVEAHRVALGPRYGQGSMTAVGDRSLDHRLVVGGDAPGARDVAVIPLAGLLDVARADRISLLKVDIEGSEFAAFEQADPATLRRFDRIAIEYHDNLRPGTLDLLRARLAPTHQLVARASGVEGCGILLAAQKAVGPEGPGPEARSPSVRDPARGETRCAS